MLLEQIIEFELRGLGPLIEHLLLNAVIFMTKQKSPKLFELLIYYSQLKILQEAMHLASSAWAKSLTKFNLQNPRF